jgi:uncharacterized protein with GYD domain
MIEKVKRKGMKTLGWYVTLSCYDAVLGYETENEEQLLKASLAAADLSSARDK